MNSAAVKKGVHMRKKRESAAQAPWRILDTYSYGGSGFEVCTRRGELFERLDSFPRCSSIALCSVSRAETIYGSFRLNGLERSSSSRACRALREWAIKDVSPIYDVFGSRSLTITRDVDEDEGVVGLSTFCRSPLATRECNSLLVSGSRVSTPWKRSCMLSICRSLFAISIVSSWSEKSRIWHTIHSR